METKIINAVLYGFEDGHQNGLSRQMLVMEAAPVNSMVVPRQVVCIDAQWYRLTPLGKEYDVPWPLSLEAYTEVSGLAKLSLEQIEVFGLRALYEKWQPVLGWPKLGQKLPPIKEGMPSTLETIP